MKLTWIKYCFLLYIVVFPCLINSSPVSSDKSRLNKTFGSDFQYSQVISPEYNMRFFAIPVIFPLEAAFNRLRLGSSLEYVRNEYKSNSEQGIVEGPSYISLDSSYKVLKSRSYKLEFAESINVSLGKNGDENTPYKARLNTGGYILDSSLTFSYFMKRSYLKLDIEHNWRLHRKEYNPGETIAAALSFGYGFGGSSLLGNRPLYVMLGFTSRYNYADRLNQEIVTGTEYGTIFITPGLRYKNKTLNFWANIELPVRQLKIVEEEETYRDRIRGNIGMQYYMW